MRQSMRARRARSFQGSGGLCYCSELLASVWLVGPGAWSFQSGRPRQSRSILSTMRMITLAAGQATQALATQI